MWSMDRENACPDREADGESCQQSAGGRRRGRFWLSPATWWIVTTSVVCLAADAGSSVSASRGRAVLEDRQCLACHSLAGEGAGTAPDLGRRSVTSEHSPAGLAALMWSHGPSMWEQMRQRSMTVTPLTRDEADDLFAYFWSLRYFDLRGEAVRGKQVFAAKNCATCHSLDPRGVAGEAPAVADWEGLSDPAVWAQQLWNHSSSMARAMAARGMAWPEFSEQEMVDLLIYLQNLPASRQRTQRLALSPPPAGTEMFKAKACATCHSLNGESRGSDPLAGTRNDFNTITGFTAAMWNHAPKHRSPDGDSASSFSADEMGDLISHLYFNGGFEESGNPGKGRGLFVKKGCQSCHGAAADDLVGSGNRFTAASMASAVWSHGPEMLEEMQKRGIEWPTLARRDVADLVAYLDGSQ